MNRTTQSLFPLCKGGFHNTSPFRKGGSRGIYPLSPLGRSWLRGLSPIIPLLLIPLVFILSTPLPAAEPQHPALSTPLPSGERLGEGLLSPIRDLYATEYFPAVHEGFQKAKESIVVTMYQIRVYPHTTSKSPTFTLLRDLIDARERGVKVTVILNNPFRQHRSEEAMKVKEKRNIAVQMLTSGGIRVRHVSVRRVLHQKLIVIDGKTVICGSHNWTDTSLKYNVESSNLIRSKKYAALKLKQISELELLPLPEAPSKTRDMYSLRVPAVFPTIPVPLSFLTRKDLAQDMVKDGDDRAFDLYLLILRHPPLSSSDLIGGSRIVSPEVPQISLNHTTTAASLGMNRRESRTVYRRQITKTLRKLQDEYDLIECTFHYGKNTDIRLTARGLGGDKRIEVPEGYWEYGLCRKLGLRAKGAYLMCLAEEAASPGKPWWTASGAALADKYPGCRHSIVYGLRELEKMNLLEIVRASPPPGQPYSRRRPNSYCLKPLLSPEAIEKQWKELADAYGSSSLDRARAQAGRFDRKNNPSVVADLLMLADTYGWTLTEKAVGGVAKMAPDNPCRHVGYIITLLRDWTKEKD